MATIKRWQDRFREAIDDVCSWHGLERPDWSAVSPETDAGELGRRRALISYLERNGIAPFDMGATRAMLMYGRWSGVATRRERKNEEMLPV
jgi:hypothetical protein